MNLTKLDTYNYLVLPGSIRIGLEGTNDAQAGDILSELSRTDGNIYLDGTYYKYLDASRIVMESDGVYLDLDVVETEKRIVL